MKTDLPRYRRAKMRATALPIVEWPKVLIFERRSEEPLPDLRRILPVCGSEGLAETRQARGFGLTGKGFHLGNIAEYPSIKAPDRSMPKKAKSTSNTARQSEPECLELLKEFVRMFETIPQHYCLFCEASTALGMEAHKPDCPWRRAAELIK
jgi:hypothetical protein